MAGENADLARRFYPGPMDLASVFADASAFETLREALRPLVHEHFETVADPRYQMLLGDPGTAADASRRSVFIGIDGFVTAFREWLTGWDSWVVTPVDFIEAGDDRVLIGIQIVGRPTAQGVEISSDGGNLMTFRDGRLSRLELFFRREDALRAAGL